MLLFESGAGQVGPFLYVRGHCIGSGAHISIPLLFVAKLRVVMPLYSKMSLPLVVAA